MHRLAYYLILSFVLMVSALPFRLLYWVSDCFYVLVFHVVRYRRTVVTHNLERSFPDKSREEIDELARAFYAYFYDFWLEAFKILGMSEEQIRARCVIRNPDLFKDLFEQKRSIIVVLGHYGNWEWTGASLGLAIPGTLGIVYQPLSDTPFDRLARRIRTRFGARLISVGDAYKDMARNRHAPTVTAFAADQAPLTQHAYWTQFLNQDTPVSWSVERIARKLNCTVIFLSTNRLRRGFYEVVPEVLAHDPGATEKGCITEAFARRLERQIITYPATWLWSHRRWKHTRTHRPAPPTSGVG